MKEIRLIGLLLVVVLFIQSADAELTYLPYSSHYQGSSSFNYANGISGRVEFAVYDTLGAYGNEWSGPTGFESPGDGRYIYAYQIFNDNASTPIERFTMWADDYHALVVDGMGEQDPQEADYLFWLDFTEPTDRGADNSGEQLWWKFEGGLLVAGESSWFLIYSSDHHWTAGNFMMEPVSSDFPVRGNPEPCTLVLLGLGGAILFAKRRNSAVKRVVIRS
jgi:hypothetical protein